MTGNWRVAAAGHLTGAPAVVFVLAGFWGLMMLGVCDRSPTFDEPVYAAGGLAAWQLRDYRLNPENGILPQRLAGLGMAGARFPAQQQPAFWRSDEWDMARQIFDQPSLRHDASFLLHGRMAMSVLALGLALAVHLMARRLFGPGAGMLSLLLCVLCPGVLANGPLMAADVAVTLFLLLATWATWAALRRPTLPRLLGGGILTGCALGAKMSGALVVPIGLALALLSAWPAPAGAPAPAGPARGRGRRIAIGLGVLAAQLAIGMVAVWSFYGFRFATMASATEGRDLLRIPWAQLSPGGVTAWLIDEGRRFHLLPEPFLYGFAFQSTLGPTTPEHVRPAFMNGEVSLLGWLAFFPYAFLVKTPLSTLLVLAVAGAAGIAAGSGRGRLIPALLRTAPLWALLLVYGAAALTSRLNSGYRHLLPLCGPLFVLAGAAWRWQPARLGSRSVRAALVGCMLLLVAEIGVRSPDYLAYFNALAGGPRGGWRHLVDSSLDWGQDLPGLARAVARTEGKTYVSYYGSLGPRSYGITSVLLPAYLGIGRVPAVVLEAQLPDESPEHHLARAAAAWPEHEGLGWLSTGAGRTLVMLKHQRLLRLTAGTYFISATMMQPLYYVEGFGPWREAYERRYQELLALLAPLLPEQGRPRLETLLDGHAPEDLSRLVRELEWLRFARLTAYLRGREPDDDIHHSILVFHLSETRLREALAGPPLYGR